MIYYVNISTEEMMDIILGNTTQKVDIAVMHNNDDKHPTWPELDISISVLTHSRFFVPRRNGV